MITATDKPREGLAGHERYLLDWLLGDCGNGVALFMDDLHTLSKSSSSAQRFLEHYQSWQSQAQAATAGRDYFDDGVKGLRLAARLIGVGLLAIRGALPVGQCQWPGRMGGRKAIISPCGSAADSVSHVHQAAFPLRWAEVPRMDGVSAVFGGFQQYERGFAAIPCDLGTLPGVRRDSRGCENGDSAAEGEYSCFERSVADYSWRYSDDPHAGAPSSGMSEAISYAVGDSISHALTASRLDRVGQLQRKRGRFFRRGRRRLWRRGRQRPFLIDFVAFQSNRRFSPLGSPLERVW